MSTKSYIKGVRGNDGTYLIQSGGKDYSFPSVTTILSKIHDESLDDLKEKFGDEEFQRITEAAANRGSVMHGFLENYAIAVKKCKDPEKALLYTQTKTPTQFTETEQPVFEKGRNMFYNIFHSEFTEEMKEPVMIEGLMVHFGYKYAGRTDIIYLDHEDNLILGDYKSSSRMLQPHENKVQKCLLQLSAYWCAFEHMYDKKIKEAVAWYSHPDGMQKFVLTKYMYPIYKTYFLKLLEENFN